MRNYDPKALVQFPFSNGYAPDIDEGPRGIPLQFDFSLDTDFDVNFAEAQAAGRIGQIQSIYIDNTQNAFALSILVKATGQRIVIPAQTEAVRPILSDVVFQAVFTSTVSAAKVVVVPLNIALAPYTYGPLTVNATSSAVTGLYTDRSVAATGATQILMAANALRKGYIIQNPSTEIESIWVNFGAAATIGSPSVEITPGSSLPPYLGISTQQIQVIAATAAHPIIAKELA